MSLSPIWTHIDYCRDGKQVSTLNVEHSVDRSAYGLISVPIAVIKNGDGPTALLIAGSHGDEYEGQIVLTRLIESIEPERISGRLIVLPAANLPAALNGTRLSPLDSGNLNRCFSPAAAHTPTRQIAQYISEALLPISSVMFDFHSGGASLEYVPCVYADLPDDAQRAATVEAALEYINCPVTWVQRGTPEGHVAAAAAASRNVMYISGEFGGGGRISRNSMTTCERALYRFLAHMNLLALDPQWQAQSPTRVFEAHQRHYIYAQQDGVFEPACALGDDLSADALIGTIWTPETPNRQPTPVVAPSAGFWACARTIGRIRSGDCLGHLLQETQLAGTRS